MNWIKTLLSVPSAKKLAEQQLQEAMRLQLQHAAQAEYHAAMVKYHQDTTDRLRQYLKCEEAPAQSVPAIPRRRAAALAA